MMQSVTIAMVPRPVESLTPADFLTHPVWEFVGADEPDETWVFPVVELPVSSLDNRIVGVEVQLANGRRVWAVLGNVDVGDARRTRHCLTLSVLVQDKWFYVARYHDADGEEHGPEPVPPTPLGAWSLTRSLSSSDCKRFSVSRIGARRDTSRRWVRCCPAHAVRL